MAEQLSYDSLAAECNAGNPQLVINQLEPLFDSNPSQLSNKFLFLLTKTLILSGNFAKAIAIAQYILSAIPSNEDTTDDALQALNSLASAEFKLGHYDQAQHYAQILAAKGEKNPESVVTAYLTLTQIQSHTGNPGAAAIELEHIYDKYKTSISINQKARVFVSLGTFYSRSGQQWKAIEAYKNAVTAALEAGVTSLHITSLHNLGVAYYELGEFELAHDYFIKVCASCHNKTLTTYILSTVCLGSIYLSYGEVDKSLSHYQEALIHAIEAKHRLYQGDSYVGIAEVYLTIGDYSLAVENLQRAEEIVKELNHRDLGLNVKHVKALLFSRLGNFTEAIQLNEEIIALREKHQVTEFIISDLIELLELYLEQNYLAPAATLVTKINHHSIQQTNPEAKKWLCYAEGCLEMRKGNLGKAQELLQLFVERVENKHFTAQQSRGHLLLAQINLLLANHPWKDFSENITKALEEVHLAATISKETKNIITYLDSLVAQAAIEMAIGKIKTAVDTLKISQQVASERQLKNYLRVINNRMDEYQDILKLENSQMAVLLKCQGPRSAIMGLSSTLSKVDSSLRYEYTNVICYRLTKQGPAIFFSEFPLDEQTSISSGAFLYTAIGQGSRYREGFFGPLPFGDKEAILVFAQRINDSMPPDTRFYENGQGFNLLLVGLTCNPDQAHLIDRIAIQSILRQEIRKINDISTITCNELQNLVTAVRKVR